MSREGLHPDSLEFAVFEKVRRTGVEGTDGQTLSHGGRRYELTAHTISTIKTVHVLMECSDADAPEVGHQRAMAIVAVCNNGYRGGPNGLAPTLTALVDGARIEGMPSLTHSYFVLPHVDVPPCFAVPLDEQEAPASNPDA